MRNIIIATALMVFALCSCTPGPIYVAKGEADSVKRSYNNKHAQSVFDKNAALFKDIYNRYSSDNVGIYQDGIGITTLEDFDKQQLHYVMVYVRPKEASFDGNSTKPEERIAKIIRDFVPKYIKRMKPSDLDGDQIEGLAFGIYWAARDYSQCDTYGGHIEYLYIFFPENAAKAYLEGKISLAEAVDQSEVMASTELKPAKPIRPVF
ncbi:MAG: hypothetical protein A4E61_00643 [Syntrophorhabdus sp. PtaB.Bin184]|jgi:hypothetical protein|nr:MAG: hypothetical protein A4E61_00643 [Syntrophorhabdus sp. PtaB.Bin184]